MITTIKNGLLALLWFFMFQFPISIVSFIGIYFTLKILSLPPKETIPIINFTFAIVATFSALSFTFSSTIKDDDEVKNITLYCGERFLHGCILFIIASVVQFFLSQTEVILYGKNHVTAAKFLYCINFIPGCLYFASLINSIVPLRELVTILQTRKKKYEMFKLF